MWVELIVKGNVANCLKALGRVEEELALRREIYAGHLILRGPLDSTTTIVSALNLGVSLNDHGRYAESKAFFRENLGPDSDFQRALGREHFYTLRARVIYATALYEDSDASIGDIREAVNILEDVCRRARRVLGDAHPDYPRFLSRLAKAKGALAQRNS